MASRSNGGRFPNVKRVMQISNSHCGPATLRMMYSQLQIRFFQREIVKAAGISARLAEHGSSLADLVMAVKRLTPDFEVWYKENCSFRDVDFVVNTKETPAGVEWQGIFEDADEDDEELGHYSLVTGIDLKKRKLWLANPYHLYAGKDMELSFSEFGPRWWDENELPGTEGKNFVVEDYRMMFILVRKEDQWPKEIQMRLGDTWLEEGTSEEDEEEEEG